MDETEFHRKADATLAALGNVLEEADKTGSLDMEYQHGALTIDLPSGKQLLLSKHVASRQLWLASPITGGLHFSSNPASGAWILPDGRTLEAVLAQELQALASLKVDF